jgi:Uma2 family endonuclease
VSQRWHHDRDDPRAPPTDVWERLTERERAGVCATLPSEIRRAVPPEGDGHRIPKTRAIEALGEFYRRIGRLVYLSSELPIYYPGERVFAPDLIAVLDVPTHERAKWVVSVEGKGLDLVLEVTLGGDAQKDLDENVERYARLGIPEYFVFDARTTRLFGYRLDGAAYRAIVPQRGRWMSTVLGLELAIEGRRVRFFHGSAPLLEATELISHLEEMMDELTARKEEAERSREEAERLRGKAERKIERLAQRLRALGVDPDEEEDEDG